MTCPGAPPWRPTRVILSNDSDKAAEAILLRCEDDSNVEWSAIAGRIQNDLK